MSENKRYYWLKLDEKFFEDDTIAWIEEQENGKDYVIFYLKLCLKSLTDNGYLVRYVGEKLIPYDVKALSKLTNTSPDTVAVAMKTFIEIGLIKQLETGEIYLNQIEEMIGSETQSAKRVRKHRAKKIAQSEKEQLESSDALQSNNDVIKSNTEIELEIDKELERELEKESESDKKQMSCYRFFENNGFGMLSANIIDQMNSFITDFTEKGATDKQADDLIIEALTRADNQGVRKWNYAKAILNSWYQEGVATLEDVQTKDKQKDTEKEEGISYGGLDF